MPPTSPASPLQRISSSACDDILALLRYSWADIDYHYDGLTVEEKCAITREHFDEVVKLLHPEKTVIHYVEQGITACMFMPGKVPKQWPQGHAWEHNWNIVNCPECLKGKPPYIETFTISRDGKSITCKRCKMTSHHPKDVEHHYCARCNVMHDDLAPFARQWWIDHPDVNDTTLHRRAARTLAKVAALTMK